MNKEAITYGIGGLILGGLLTFFVTSSIDTTSRGELSMSDMTAVLKGKSGDEFDRAFIETMKEHHKGAIDMASLISTRAKHNEIKELGQEIIVAQTKEVNQMEQWAKDWGYGETDGDRMMHR